MAYDPFAQPTSGGVGAGGTYDPFASPTADSGASPEDVSSGDSVSTYQFKKRNQSPLDSVDGLLSVAQMQGGAIAEQANAIVHPTTSILSTIGNGFKNAFKGFVDTISIPSEVVAGVLSDKYSIDEAVAQHLRPSDVLFGKEDPNATTMQKVGGFLVRTAADILTDPLTYVTFGASDGIFGLRALSEVGLGENAAARLGKDTAHLSSEGQDIYKQLLSSSREAQTFEGTITSTLKGLSAQMRGTAAADALATGDSTYELAGRELDKVLATTIDAPLNTDYAKIAMTNLLEKYPQLTETLLDKGGVKMFGKTLIEGQRISSAMRMIPGMTTLDAITAPARTALAAMFNPNYEKVGSQYVRLPGEWTDLEQASKDLAESIQDKRLTDFTNIVKANNLDTNETKLLFAAVEADKMPADERLAKAFTDLKGLDANELEYLRASGIPVTKLDNHVAHVLTKQKTSAIPFKVPPSTTAGAAIERKLKGPVFGTAETIPKELEPLAQVARQSKDAEEFATKAEASGIDTSLIPEVNGVRDVQKFFTQANTTLTELEKQVLDKDNKNIEQVFKDIKNDGFEIFDDNIVTASARRSLDNSRVGIARDFMRSAAHFGRPASEAPDKWVPVSSTALKTAGKEVSRVIGFDEAGKPIEMSADRILSGLRAENGEQLLFHPAIAARIEKMVGAAINDEPTKDFLRAYDSINNLFKASVTSIFPAFHGRNAISNVLQNFADLGYQALNPKTHALSAQLVYMDRQADRLATKAYGVGEGADAAKNELHDMMTRKVFTDSTGHEWSFGELQRVIKDHNVAFTSKAGTDSADIQEGAHMLFPEASVAGKAKNLAQKALPIGQNFVPFKVGRSVGSAIEEQARLVNFLSNLHNTGDVMHAAKRTKQFMFDYGNLTNFEKTFLRRIIPFYSYTRKNLEMQARTLMEAPGRTAAQVQGLQNLSDVMSGGQLTPEQEAALPDWIKTGVELVRSKDGNNVTILSSLGTPLEQPFQAFQPNQLLGSISPVIRIPFESASGYSLYQGKMLSDVTNATAFRHAPDAIKNLIGFTSFQAKRSDGTSFEMDVALNPSMMNFLLNLPPTSRVLSGLKQMDAVDVSEQDKIMQQIIGSKPYSFDIQQEQQKRINEQKAALQSLLTKAGVTAQFTKTFMPKPRLTSLN